MQVSCESCGALYESRRFTLLRERRSHYLSSLSARLCGVPRGKRRSRHLRSGNGDGDGAEDLPRGRSNFRKVGIQAWKVKVKIGLVYDFSDYKTLAKYITDGRVTTADKISHDGKDWIEIGSIPDLAQHFVDVYIKAEHEQSGAGSGPEVSGVSEFDGDEPTDIFGLQQAEAEEAAKKAVSAPRIEPKKEPKKVTHIPAPSKSSSMGVDDELMKMAQNISADMASGNAMGSGPSRFVDPFEQMRRKKRRPAVEVSPEAVAKAGGADSSEGSSSRTKIYLGILFAVVAVALVVVYTQMGSSPPPTDAGKNQGQEQAKQAQESADESLEDPTQTPVIPLSTESSLDAFSNVSSDAFLDESGRAYTVDEVEQRDTIHFMKVPMTEEECPSNWYAIDNGKPVQKADASCTAQGGAVEPVGLSNEGDPNPPTQEPPPNRGPELSDIEAMILVKAPLAGNEDAAECNTRSSDEAWRVLSTMADSPDVNFLKGLYQTICKNDDDTASRYYSEVGGKAKVRAWNTWASDFE